MLRRPRRDGWFVQRGYSHIDRPLSFDAAEKLVKNAKRVEQNVFFPFLGYTDRKRRFGIDKSPSSKSIPRKNRPKIIKFKDRELKYASHRDSYIYSYYAHILSEKYEKFLKSNNLEDCVVGYRSGLGSNIDIAASAFAEIEARKECTALCFDIKDFFPSIPHKPLKMNLSRILGVELLSPDWYKLYRSLTRYTWIDIDKLYFMCLIDPKIHVPNPLCNDPSSLLSDFRSLGMIKGNKAASGIPQGSPISAIFANIVMCEFDIAIKKWSDSNNAAYFRYSDDILLIANREQAREAEVLVENALSIHTSTLKISVDKTERSSFWRNERGLTADMPMTYLGFTFDGQSVRLRDRTLSRYYRRMTYATRGTAKSARLALKKGGKPAPFRRSLFADFTHLGNSNFYSYSKKAQNTFGGKAIRRQLRNHFKVLMRKLNNRGR